MTNEDKDLRISYMIYAWAIDPEDDVEDQFLDWYQCREDVVPGETHYKAILDVARVGSRSYQRGYRPAGDVGRLEVNPKLGGSTGFRQVLSDHSDPCGCYTGGYAVGRAEARDQHRRDRGA